ncbi:MAG TPA: hypothetical protein VGJ87_15095 [Roseiflexaceae bacterium]
MAAWQLPQDRDPARPGWFSIADGKTEITQRREVAAADLTAVLRGASRW